MALAVILIGTKFFGTAKFECYVPTLSTKTMDFWIAVAFATIAAFIGTWMASSCNRSFTISNATVTKWLPWDLMGPVGFMRTFKYAIILLPFTLVISTLNNMWSIKNVSDRMDTLINVIATSIGSELVVWLALAITFSTAGHGTVWDVHTILSVIVMAPIMSYIYRKMYKVTGSMWAGAALVALILGWRLASYVSHQFIYYGPDPIKAFWGFY